MWALSVFRAGGCLMLLWAAVCSSFPSGAAAENKSLNDISPSMPGFAGASRSVDGFFRADFVRSSMFEQAAEVIQPSPLVRRKFFRISETNFSSLPGVEMSGMEAKMPPPITTQPFAGQAKAANGNDAASSINEWDASQEDKASGR